MQQSTAEKAGGKGISEAGHPFGVIGYGVFIGVGFREYRGSLAP